MSVVSRSPHAYPATGRARAAVLHCSRCDAEAPWEFRLRCRECSGALEPRFDLSDASVPDVSGGDAGGGGRDVSDPVLRYFDLLPLTRPDEIVPGVCVRTPCVHADDLGRHIGLPDLWLKCEYVQPTGSTKDRMAAVVVPLLRELGVTGFVASSTGNSSTSLARAAALYGGPVGHFFAAAPFVDRHAHMDDPNAVLHVVDGDFVEASRVAKLFAAENGLVWEGGFFDWARREGLKIAYLEAIDRMPRAPAVVAQAISSGMGVVGAQKGIEEYRALGRLVTRPRIVMAQQSSCAPMANGWAKGQAELGPEDVVVDPTGPARAILRGDGSATYPYLYDIARRTGGDIVSVRPADIDEAHRLLLDLADTDVCMASAVCLAGVIQQRRIGRIREDETVLVNLTGSERVR